VAARATPDLNASGGVGCAGGRRRERICQDMSTPATVPLRRGSGEYEPARRATLWNALLGHVKAPARPQRGSRVLLPAARPVADLSPFGRAPP
jgi:hypothetical protein